jgi:hypothetical protein
MPVVLLTTVSCSTLSIDLAECDLSSGIVTEEQVLPPREEPRSKARREQASTSATPKATKASNTTNGSGSGDAPKKKAGTSPKTEVQKEQRLFNEFLDWRKSQGGGDRL